MILTVDVGSSSLKAALVSSGGRVTAKQRIPYPDRFRKRDAREWLWALGKYCSENDLEHITAVSISGNGPTLVPLTREGKPVGPVLFWREAPPSREYRSFYLPGLLYYRSHFPDSYERTELFIPAAEYLCYLLTGEKRAVTPPGDFQNCLWSLQELVSNNLTPERLPLLQDYRDPIGLTGSKESRELGLPNHIPVYAAGSDYIAALLGTGTVFPGTACDRAGSTEGINAFSNQPVNNPALRSIPHLFSGKYNTAALLGPTGYLFESWREKLGFGSTDYRKLLMKTESPLWERGCFYKAKSNLNPLEGSFVGRDKPRNDTERLAAVMLGIALSFREGITRLEEAGIHLEKITLSGGQAENPEWCQIKSSLSGKTLALLPDADGELAGCAILAEADASGDRDLLATIRRNTSKVTLIEPEANRQSRTDELCKLYRDDHPAEQASTTL